MAGYPRDIDASVDDGLITLVCFGNDAAAKRMRISSTQNRDVMYAGGSIGEIHAMIPGDFVFLMDDCPTNSLGQSPAVASTLNGYGAREKEAFPDDEEMQVRALMSKIRPIGVVPIGLGLKEGGSGAVSIAVSGKHRHRNAIKDMPTGTRYRMRPMLPSEQGKQITPHDPFGGQIAMNRAPLVAEPVVPKSMFDTAVGTLCHLDHYLNNRASYLTGMGRNEGSTDMWVSYGANMGDFAVTCGAHFVHMLMRAGFIAPPLIYRLPDGGYKTNSKHFPRSIAAIGRSRDNEVNDVLSDIVSSAVREAISITVEKLAPSMSPGELSTLQGAVFLKTMERLKGDVFPHFLKAVDPANSADDYLRKLLASMGVINAAHCPEVSYMADISDEMLSRKKDFLNEVFLSGRVVNHEFGISADGGSIAKDARGNVTTNTIDGKVLSNQYNSFKKAISSMSDAVNDDIMWQGGVVTVGCTKGGTWEGLHGL
jgi:hypothetical protein